MSGKKNHSLMLEEAKRYLKEQELPDFEELAVQVCLRDITLEEKVEEARKPLFLKRYE